MVPGTVRDRQEAFTHCISYYYHIVAAEQL